MHMVQVPDCDGLDVLQEACVTASVNLVPLIETTCWWVHPNTFREMPVWFPETARRQPMYNADYTRQYTNTRKQTGETINKVEPNIHAAKALVRALGIPSRKKPYNWTVCHVWGIDDHTYQRPNTIVQDPHYYSCVTTVP